MHEITDRPGDVGGGERSGRDLVEQRLKQMMVASIDQGNLNRRAFQPVGRLQPAEAGANDHHAMRMGRSRSHEDSLGSKRIDLPALMTPSRLRSNAGLSIGR